MLSFIPGDDTAAGDDEDAAELRSGEYEVRFMFWEVVFNISVG